MLTVQYKERKERTVLCFSSVFSYFDGNLRTCWARDRFFSLVLFSFIRAVGAGKVLMWIGSKFWEMTKAFNPMIMNFGECD